MNPKTVTLALALVLMSYQPLLAQTGNASETKFGFKRNLVKLNVPALSARNLSVQYERGINKDISVSLGFRYMPLGRVPYPFFSGSLISDGPRLDLPDNSENTKVTSWGLTLEARYYFGKKPLSGFYTAPYLRFGKYHYEWTQSFPSTDQNYVPVSFSEEATEFSGGLMIGAQWKIRKRLVLDWWIAGVSAGSRNITLVGSGPLSILKDSDRMYLQNMAIDIVSEGKQGIYSSSITNGEVRSSANNAMVSGRIGLCIGYTF